MRALSSGPWHKPCANNVGVFAELRGAVLPAASAPVKVVDTDKVQAYHVLDCSFATPKAACHLQLTNFAVEKSARTAVGLRMLLEMVQEVEPPEA